MAPAFYGHLRATATLSLREPTWIRATGWRRKALSSRKLKFIGESRCTSTLRGKGGHHAREVLELDNGGCHCGGGRGRHHCGVGHADGSSSPGSLSPSIENALGRTRSAGHLDRRDRHAISTVPEVCEPRIFHRCPAGRI